MSRYIIIMTILHSFMLNVDILRYGYFIVGIYYSDLNIDREIN